mmetsp:Transcript_39631/g.92638  ORF Transcript_39631/g.92638 Transcript_39631/m.92638 type:complete len:280 (+) Transcript_39631:157-996(+)
MRYSPLQNRALESILAARSVILAALVCQPRVEDATQSRITLIEGRRRVDQRALQLLIRPPLRFLSAPQALNRILFLLLQIGNDAIRSVASLLFLEHAVLHLGLQRLLMLHPLLHALPLHLRSMVLDHRRDLFVAFDGLVVLLPEVLLDHHTLFAQDGRFLLLLRRQRVRVAANGVAHSCLGALQSLPRALLLPLLILFLLRFANLHLLIARLQLDNLVSAPPRLFNLLERLALFLPQPLQAVLQQLHVVLRTLPCVLHVVHVRAGKHATWVSASGISFG